MELTDDRNWLKLQKSKHFCAIKGDNVISSIGAPLQTLGAPNTPLWIVHSVLRVTLRMKQPTITSYNT